MKKLLIPILILAGCSSAEEQQPGGNSQSAAPKAQSSPSAAEPARISTLTGLYQGKSDPPNQMCVVEGKDGETRFGLVVWGDDLHSCSGSGTVTRSGDTLRLAMAGDSACTVEARLSGKTIRLPADVPEGCAYYCGARARLAGAELTQAGTTESDAMKAKDLVGEPLCGGEGG